MDIVQVVKGDTGPNLKTTITRTDTGSPFSASGKTVRLRIREKGTTNIISTIESDDLLSENANGILVFPLEDFLTDSSVSEGFYEAEVEFEQTSDNKIMSAFEIIQIKVRNEFG